MGRHIHTFPLMQFRHRHIHVLTHTHTHTHSVYIYSTRSHIHKPTHSCHGANPYATHIYTNPLTQLTHTHIFLNHHTLRELL